MSASENRRRLAPHEYTVGWISALPVEHAAAAEMLDEEHEPPRSQDGDSTLYTLGRIHGHCVVIACLPAGLIGIASAASIATRLADRFPNAKIGLMVGIGGGVPSVVDIRLGDVVVSQPGRGHGGVVQYDMGKRLPGGRFEKTSHLDKPPNLLLSAVAQVRSNHIRGRSTFARYLSQLERNPEFGRKEAGPDRLFYPTYQHASGPSCAGCDEQQLIKRDSRSQRKAVQIHYGTIASANSLIKNGIERDAICQGLDDDILCFEMEAAGLMNSFPCLVVRGICDYADSHKNKRWQAYAAATAAAYAKEILSVIPPTDIADLAPIQGTLCRHFLVPFGQNEDFVGRKKTVNWLLERITPGTRPNDC
jgi:nucleoside phosphorylase